ncbi:MAG: DUF2490 domain-containing protein [Ekhidna sp.]|uniref:DUF2490 domain-containing protein n=1 Tax=Ekhidna sp. TaxID=2608089 RepID=UPI0032EC6EBA
MKKIILLIAALTSLNALDAQETHGDSEFWFLLLNHYKINEQWTVGNELHIRQTEFISEKKQFILRPFVNFMPGESVIYSAGYSYINTQPYGKYPLPIAQPEHNFWEQVTVNQTLNKTSLSHRYRMEHRYQGNLVEMSPGEFEVNGHNFSNRFRYRLTIRQPISEKYFIQAFDELWVSMDKKFKQASYNQNWIYVGLGRNIKQGNVQLAYLHQHASANGIVERHPTFQVTVQYDF